MSVMVQCPICRRKQSLRNKRCTCGEDLDAAKRSGRVKYWLCNRLPARLPDGSLRRVVRWELSGASLDTARDENAKRRVQVRERRIMDIAPKAVTFRELADWYLGLDAVKALAYHPILKINLAAFCRDFGAAFVDDILPADLKDYQARRTAAGLSDSYIDQELGAAKRVIYEAADNNKVGPHVVMTFRRVKKLLRRKTANARKRILAPSEFWALMKALPTHTTQILATGFYTGMRYGEILALRRDQVRLAERLIILDAAQTKDREARTIPISDALLAILLAVTADPRAEEFFTFRGRAIRDIRKPIREACAKLGIPYGRTTPGGFVFHDLRHTFNTFMRRAGVPEGVIMELTGHATREMFDRYDTVDLDDKRKALQTLERFLRRTKKA